MLRLNALLIVAAGLAVGCASSSSQNSVQNPDDGKVEYDVGKADDGGSADGSGGTTPTEDGGQEIKGRDQTGTRGVGAPKKAVKKLAASKPTRPDPTDPANKPARQTKVTPNGLLAAFYKLDAGATGMPDLSTVAADGVGLVKNVDFADGKVTGAPSTLGTTFAVNFTGSLNIRDAAEYKLCLNSSDGSSLFLDGSLIVDNSGVHEAKEVCEVVYMDPGEYSLNLQYFTVSGTSTLQFTWSAAGGESAVVPETSLFKPEGADDLVKKSKKR